ncbi:ABC transporter permease [Pusillimonas noertemannii]|uniref:NitT/TauT family transport system permease protein n=1 Tax=Pusillimonas noertemannii TaxID=305977 RepID=A0A2U1CJS8_9BURK|nr:ABC transporter permease [Pusillimonas noertemannii]NYT69831.1 ABC transporter permease [Pusillimonas noertemannii]PVY61245.1 NitT/TauT family transport system permease protein [Pusillimonas noertemannii]
MPLPSSRIRAPRKETFFAFISPLTVLIIWELCSRLGWADDRILPAPTTVLVTLADLAREGELWEHLGHTASRFGVGMVLGTIPGILLGLTMGMFRWCRIILRPIITVLYPLPRIALFPLFLILVGLNETSNVLMIALGPFFTMVISSMAGVLNIDPIYKDVAASFETKPLDLYRKVMLPASMPVIMSGVHISIGLALMTTTAVEYLNADTGLGYLIWHSWQILSLKLSLAALLAAGMMGSLIFGLFQWLERLLLPWQQQR